MRNNIRGFMKLRWYLCILEDNRLAQSLKYRTGCAFCICQSWNPWLSLEHSFIIKKKSKLRLAGILKVLIMRLPWTWRFISFLCIFMWFTKICGKVGVAGLGDDAHVVASCCKFARNWKNCRRKIILFMQLAWKGLFFVVIMMSYSQAELQSYFSTLFRT